MAQTNAMSPYQRGFLAGVQAGLGTHGESLTSPVAITPTPARRRGARRRTSGARGLPNVANATSAAATKRRRTRKRRTQGGQQQQMPT